MSVIKYRSECQKGDKYQIKKQVWYSDVPLCNPEISPKPLLTGFISVAGNVTSWVSQGIYHHLINVSIYSGVFRILFHLLYSTHINEVIVTYKTFFRKVCQTSLALRPSPIGKLNWCFTCALNPIVTTEWFRSIFIGCVIQIQMPICSVKESFLARWGHKRPMAVVSHSLVVTSDESKLTDSIYSDKNNN